MSDAERGAYTPESDAPLSFDARRPPRGGGPAPMALVISGMVLIVVIAAIAYFYRGGVRAKDGPPQPVGAVLGATKAAPGPAEAQPLDPAQGLQIYDSKAQGPDAPTTFAAGPEEPQPRAAPPPTPVAPPQNAGLRPSQPVVAEPTTKPAGTKPAAPVAVVPGKASSAPAPVPVQPAPPKPAVVAAAKPVAVKPAAAAAGVARVQIGAFSSAALADKGWNDAARIAPGAAVGKGKAVEAIDKNGATLYRTSVTGFASKAEAAAFCSALKAAGKDCFVK